MKMVQFTPHRLGGDISWPLSLPMAVLSQWSRLLASLSVSTPWQHQPTGETPQNKIFSKLGVNLNLKFLWVLFCMLMNPEHLCAEFYGFVHLEVWVLKGCLTFKRQMSLAVLSELPSTNFSFALPQSPRAGRPRRWHQVESIMHVLMSLLRGRNHSSAMAASQGHPAFP